MAYGRNNANVVSDDDFGNIQAAIDAAASPSGSNAFVTVLGLAGFSDVSYTYNGDGSVATSVSDGLTLTFAYNADGTVNTATASTGEVTTYSYNADGTVSGSVVS